MSDDWLDECIITYSEKEMSDSDPNEITMQHYLKITN